MFFSGAIKSCVRNHKVAQVTQSPVSAQSRHSIDINVLQTGARTRLPYPSHQRLPDTILFFR